MLADLDEFLRAAALFMEFKHRLLEALLNGRPIAVNLAEILQEMSAKFDMFVRLNRNPAQAYKAYPVPCLQRHRRGIQYAVGDRVAPCSS